MSARPELEFSAFLGEVGRRVRRRAALMVASGTLAAGAIGVLATGSGGSVLRAALIPAGIAVAVGAITWLAPAESRTRIAAAIERRTPASRNLVVTASELLDAGDTAPGYVRTRVFDDAARLTRQLSVTGLVPFRPAWLAIVIAAAAWSGAIAWASTRARETATARPSSPNAASVSHVTVEIIPPDYARQAARTHEDPPRVEALAGSTIRVTVQGDAARMDLETIGGRQAIDAAGARRFSTAILADADGFLAITPTATDGTMGVRRLVGVSVTPDEAPRVKMTAPGKDLLLANGDQTIALGIDAQDDLGLATLQVKFTRIAGSGESFTFTEGDVPIEISKASDRGWTGRTTWRLGPLGLQPGDMVIYRATATDRRPGAPAAESETFIIEIASAGSLASEGFAVDDRPEKYAISQQMVILKTERLLARRGSMTAEEFRDEALGLAAEQRQVRAEFVFMMGGELSDAGLDPTTLNEEEEAAGEDDLAAGRLANQGRTDLMRAIRSMSRAAARLADGSVPAALPIEKEALASLQRAFSRSRYILRTLSERERLDLSRRLTGVLAALAKSRRPAAEPAPPPRAAALRRLLADTAALAGALRAGVNTGARATELAQRLLQVDPASAEIAEIATLLAAPGSLTPASLDRVTAALAALVRADLGAAPASGADPERAALEGALADEQRRGGGRR
jgi:hypothetical protein